MFIYHILFIIYQYQSSNEENMTTTSSCKRKTAGGAGDSVKVEREVSIKDFIKSKRRRLDESNKALQDLRTGFEETKKKFEAAEAKLKKEFNDAFDELGDEIEHLKFLNFLAKAETNVLYVLPFYIMNMLHIEPMHAGKTGIFNHEKTNIFHHYRLFTPCSEDVLRHILSFKNNYETGLMEIELRLFGNAKKGILDEIIGTDPENYELAMEDTGDVDFYTGDNFLSFEEADTVEINEDNNDFCLGYHTVTVVWMKKIC